MVTNSPFCCTTARVPSLLELTETATLAEEGPVEDPEDEEKSAVPCPGLLTPLFKLYDLFCVSAPLNKEKQLFD